MNLRQAEEYLLDLELFGMRFGLDRMHKLMTVLGMPQRRFATVHVVGTNGKSSTVRFLAAILERHGLRTGSYTSPHLARFTERARDAVTVFDPHDYSAPYASGSASVDGYVVCPCSMATAGTIATGGEADLIHRAAGVALKEERKLVLVPRETPLSTIHLENLLTLRRAGATILFAAPGFYHGAETVDDLVNFVAGRALAQLGLEQTLVKPWGDE